MQPKTYIIIGCALLVVAFGGWLMYAGDTPPASTGEPVVVSQDRLIASDSASKGSASAVLTIVEFSDFQCPACGSQYEPLKKFAADHPDTVRVVYRHFPLQQHQYARSTAAAAEAAGLQGKFWDMHNQLFEHQSKLGDDDIRSYARAIGLDFDRFERDWKSAPIASRVSRDLALGIELGVNSTPTLFINGVKSPGVRTYAQLQNVLDSLLQ